VAALVAAPAEVAAPVVTPAAVAAPAAVVLLQRLWLVAKKR
jgi:hypothetical protein